MTIGHPIDNDENDTNNTNQTTTRSCISGNSGSQIVMNSNNDNEDEFLNSTNSKYMNNDDTNDNDNGKKHDNNNNKNNNDQQYNDNDNNKNTFYNIYRIRKLIEWIRHFLLNRLLIGSNQFFSHNNDKSITNSNNHQYITNTIQNMRKYIVSILSESSKSTSTKTILITTVTSILLVYIRKRMIVQQRQQQRSIKQQTTLLSSLLSFPTSLSPFYIHQLHTLLQQQLLRNQSFSHSNNDKSSKKSIPLRKINLQSSPIETKVTKTKSLSSIQQQSKSIVSKGNNNKNSMSRTGRTVSTSRTIPVTISSSSSSLNTSANLNNRPIRNNNPSNNNSSKKIDSDSTSNTVASSVASIFITCIPFIYLSFLYRILQSTVNKDQKDSMVFGLSKIWSKRKHTNDDNNTIVNGPTFNDVAGIDDAIIEINEIVQYLQNPIQYKQYGIVIPTGVLLYGPAGTGKTLLARAVATEANVNCFIHCSASEFIEIYVGRGAARIRSIFTTAKQQAITNYNNNKIREQQQQQNTLVSSLLQSTYLQNIIPSFLIDRWMRLGTDPNDNKNETNINNNSNKEIKSSCCSAIIFIDELDALGKCRSTSGGGVSSSSGANDEREQTLNQLLTEMDGFATKQSTSTTISTTATNKDGHDDSNNNRMQLLTEDDVTVVVIAASNRADVLDPAIVRRFPRQIHIGYPNATGREAILRTHARRIPVIENDVDNSNNTSIESKDNTIQVTTTTTKTAPTKIHWDILASDDMTNNFTGSDLRNVINEAAMYALREKSQYVQQYHFEQAIYKIQQMKQGILHCHLTNKFNISMNGHDNPIPNLFR